MSSNRLAIAALAVVNVFAASPWGAATAALAAVTPAPLRAQSAALFFMVLSVLGGMGPVAVAQFTDHVFGIDQVRYSIAAVVAFSMTLSVLLLIAGLRAYRTTLREVNG